MGIIKQISFLSALLLLAQSVHGIRRRLTSASSRSLSVTIPNYSIYHRHDELLSEVERIVQDNSRIMKMEILTAQDGNYKVDLRVVTIEPGGFSSRDNEKIRLLLDFGEHGRELISSELGLLLLQSLAAMEGPEGKQHLAGLFPGSELERWRQLRRLMQGTVWKILPLENEGGRRAVEHGRLCERKNGRGVDPNRNWPVDWGVKEPDYDPNEEFPGKAPFSEPEVQLIKSLATSFAPAVWLNVHSGMEAMLAPWDHRAEVADSAKPALEILRTIQRDVMSNTSCVVGSGGKEVGYLAHGTATDYMHSVLHVPMASTWEIFGDFDAPFEDCFRMFNPLDEAGYKSVLRRWLSAIIRLVELLPSHPALKDSTAWHLADTTTDTAPSSSGSADTIPLSLRGAEKNGSGPDQGTWTGPADSTLTRTPSPSSTTTTPSTNGEVSGATTTRTTGSEAGADPSSTSTSTGSDLVASTTTSTTSPGSTRSSNNNNNSNDGDKEIYGDSGSSSKLNSQQEAHDQAAGGTGDVRLTVVASRTPWVGSGLMSSQGMVVVALVGLVVVGSLAARCLSRARAEQRSARGGSLSAV